MLEAEALSSPQVVDLAKGFVCIKVQTDKDPAAAAELKASSLPDLRILSAQGAELWRSGYTSAEVVAGQMKLVLAKQ